MTTSPLVQNPKPNETATTTSKKRNPTIEDFQFRDGLPKAAELPCSDGAAVDSELQEFIPGLIMKLYGQKQQMKELSLRWLRSRQRNRKIMLCASG